MTDQIVVDARELSTRPPHEGRVLVGSYSIELSGATETFFKESIAEELATRFVLDDRLELRGACDAIRGGARYLVEMGPVFRTTRLDDSRLGRDGDRVLVVDLSLAREVVGAGETIFYSGAVVVGFRTTRLFGKTDRDLSWEEVVSDGIMAQFPLSKRKSVEELVRTEMALGETYHVGCCPDLVASPVSSDEIPTIWRVHAEKIAEDVAAGISAVPRDLGEIIKFVMKAIAKTVALREEE